MNNDSKTTLFGFVKSALIAALAALTYFGGVPVDSVMQTVTASSDWGALILAVIAAVSFLVDYYTNKQDQKKG